jgi:hypothetical protein
MRKGQNPAKMGLKAYQPLQLGILLVVYIPNQGGYFAESLKILEYQVASIHRNTSAEFDLHVFDNASCQEVKDALHKFHANGWIDWLTLSNHNMGKAGALNWALRGMPNEIICYSDGDVYFRPGWYENTMKILKTFPQTGMVTSQPCFFDNLGGNGRAHLELRDREDYQFSTRLADEASAEEYVRSVGKNPDLLIKYNQHSWDIIRDKSTGVEAVIGSSPFQFIGYKTTLDKILPLSYTQAMREDVQITARLDNLGFLQLSTTNPFVYHMGNQVDETTINEVLRDNLPELKIGNLTSRLKSVNEQSSNSKKQALGVLKFLTRLPFFKKSLQRMYDLLFEYFSKVK